MRLLIDADSNIDHLKAAIRRRLAEAQGFYSGATVTLEPRGAMVPAQWVEEVRAILEENGLKVEGADESARARARLASELSAASAEAVEGAAVPAPSGIAGADTLLVKQSLRSGQSVAFEGNLVILGDVNPGSEVWADGDIVVFGAVKGVVHAGASGSRDARVVALRLMPTQLRIADKITRAPDDDVKASRGPEQAFLKDGTIVIEPWTTYAGTVFGG